MGRIVGDHRLWLPSSLCAGRILNFSSSGGVSFRGFFVSFGFFDLRRSILRGGWLGFGDWLRGGRVHGHWHVGIEEEEAADGSIAERAGGKFVADAGVVGLCLFGVAGSLSEIAKTNQCEGSEVGTAQAVVRQYAEDLGCITGFPLLGQFGTERSAGAGLCRVISRGIDELAQRGNRGVLLAFRPLFLGEQDRGAASGAALTVVLEDVLKRCEIIGLVERVASRGFAAFIDAFLHHISCNAEGGEQREDEDFFVMLIEKAFEGTGALADFAEGTCWGVRFVGFFRIAGHGRCVASIAEGDESGRSGEINAELAKLRHFYRNLRSIAAPGAVEKRIFGVI